MSTLTQFRHGTLTFDVIDAGSRDGSRARRFTRAQPRYCVLASSRRFASRRSARAMTAGT